MSRVRNHLDLLLPGGWTATRTGAQVIDVGCTNHSNGSCPGTWCRSGAFRRVLPPCHAAAIGSVMVLSSRSGVRLFPGSCIWRTEPRWHLVGGGWLGNILSCLWVGCAVGERRPWRMSMPWPFPIGAPPIHGAASALWVRFGLGGHPALLERPVPGPLGPRGSIDQAELAVWHRRQRPAPISGAAPSSETSGDQPCLPEPLDLFQRDQQRERNSDSHRQIVCMERTKAE
jgi:hypothetical protein